VKPTATAGSSKVTPAASTSKVAAPAASAPANQQPIALPGAAEIAARNNPLPKSSPEDAVKPETMTSAPAEKEKSINAVAAAAAGSKIDHLSAPPSAIPSGTATPAEKKDEENTTAEKEKAKVDHLSAPPSAIPSGTATPAAEKEEVKKEATSAPADKAVEDSKAETPAGSTVDDVKNVDKRASIAEEIIKEISPKRTYEDLASVISGVEGMQVGEGAKVGEQEAKKAEDAVKSVED